MLNITDERVAMIQETIFLAEDYSKESDKVFPRGEFMGAADDFLLGIGDNSNGALLYQKERALTAYLESLDYDDVQFIQTVMYVGREGYEKENSPSELYDSVFKSLSWSNSKSIEVSQIFSKANCLKEYLSKGMKLLQNNQ